MTDVLSFGYGLIPSAFVSWTVSNLPILLGLRLSGLANLEALFGAIFS